MSTRTRESAADRIFDNIVERQTSVFDAVRSGNERVHRFNRSLIEGARQSTRDWAEVGRAWVNNPTDLVSMYETASEAIGNSQARSLALVREWAEDTVEAQRESREVLRQSLGDVREVVQRVQEGAPELLERARTAIAARRANGGTAGAES
ncbi:MAG: hypothetical protein WD904_12550 [Dehalococcoidia bacterium]